MRISYDGSQFHGWQYQPDVISGQEIFEKALYKLTKKKTTSFASGRTDSGVHAICQYLHFEMETNMSPESIRMAINTKLPGYIRVLEAQEIPQNLHARFQAYKRSYLYFITKEKNPFIYKYKSFFPFYKIELDKMRNCFKHFIGEKDFLPFSKPNPKLKSTICNLQELSITERKHDFVIRITSNRFLHNMVRRIVGTSLLFSKKNYDLKIIDQIFENKIPNQKYIFTAPANGLFLSKVYYPNCIDPTSMEGYEKDFLTYF